MSLFSRHEIFPESHLPDARELLAEGSALARSVNVGDCPFLSEKKVASESEYEWRTANRSEVMVHSQIGYRDPAKTRRAYREIWEKAGEQGARVDRYGICLD